MTGIGILHLGLGAFHRAHQAAYTHDAMQAQGGDWGIVSVSMRKPALARAVAANPGGYGLVVRHPDGPEVQHITAIQAALALPTQGRDVIASFAQPGLHVVTITVTEKGYTLDRDTGAPDWTNLVVMQDLTQPDAPCGLLGVLTTGLAHRKAAGLGGVTLMSCDNLPDNGRMLERATLEFATRRDPDLAAWIETECTFPNAMVDRITPAQTPETQAISAAALGRDDPLAVDTEPFRQWVIEDRFAGPRPAWEAAGAQIVPDVRPYEEMKLRMLNGAHSCLAYMGALAGLEAVRDVMADAELSQIVRRYMSAAAASLPETPGLDPDAYSAALVARFSNRAIDHRCLQIATDGSQKLPQRIFAPAAQAIREGGDTAMFALAVAAWIRVLAGRDDAGAELPLSDPMAADLRAAAAQSDPVAALAAVPGLVHHDTLVDPSFVAAVAQKLGHIAEGGVRAAARACLEHA